MFSQTASRPFSGFCRSSLLHVDVAGERGLQVGAALGGELVEFAHGSNFSAAARCFSMPWVISRCMRDTSALTGSGAVSQTALASGENRSGAACFGAFGSAAGLSRRRQRVVLQAWLAASAALTAAAGVSPCRRAFPPRHPSARTCRPRLAPGRRPWQDPWRDPWRRPQLSPIRPSPPWQRPRAAPHASTAAPWRFRFDLGGRRRASPIAVTAAPRRARSARKRVPRARLRPLRLQRSW
jgi:hypothetical protein